MKITEFSVKNSQFTFIVFLAVMALGLGSLFNMPRAEDPKFSPPGFNVVIVYPGAGPAEIEEKITDKVEEKLGALENIDRMRSLSLNGVMLMTIEFLHGQDGDKKYEEVIREVNALRPELPEDLYSVRIQRFSASDVAILQSALVSETATWEELRREAERLEEVLEKIPGVKGADTWGFPKKQVRIDLDLPKMAALNIPLSRVLGAMQSENVSIPGGAVNAGDRMFFVETSGDYQDIDEIRNTIINAAGGSIVYLRDLARVDFAYEEPRHYARLNGVRSVWVTTRMKDEQNINEVGAQVNSTVAAFRADLPSNMDYQRVFDQNDSVTKRLSRFVKDFAIAILLVLITLIPLGWRASLVVMISIPLSIAIGLFTLDQMGYSLNQLSIVGLIISLGILVDDSIVVVENIERWLREGHSRKEAAILATKQIGLAVLGCTATLILAFLPLVFLPDASGDFIRSLPMAVVTTVLASLFVSLTIVPFLGSRILAEHEDPRGNVFLRGMKWLISKSYARLLNAGLRHPVITLLAAVLILGGVMSLAGRAGFAVFPASERPMFYVDVEMAAGTNMEQTDKVTRLVDSVLNQYLVPGFNQRHLYGEDSIMPNYYTWKDKSAIENQQLITWYASNVGRGNPRIYYNVIREIESPDYGQIFVQLMDRTPPPVKVKLIETLREQLKNIPGAVINVKNFEQGPPIEAPVVVRVFGENLDTLRNIAGKVETLLENTEGTMYIDNPISIIKTDLQVRINKEKASMLGVPIAEIDRMVRLSIAGLSAGEFTAADNGEAYDIVVTVPRQGVFSNIDALNKVYVNGVTGLSVPLSQLAEVQFKPSPNTITHYNKARYTLVSAFVKNGYSAISIINDLNKKLEGIKLPEGYSFVMAGEAESAQRSFGGMGTIIMITIFGLLAVLILEFGTFKSTLVVLSVIPLGIIGAVLILLATGYPFSFTVVVGLIALMGIEVKNSILLVDFTNQLRTEGRSLDEAIQEAGEIRFVPILLTSLTAIGGLIPLAIEENPLYSPLAYVLIGGLISSTLLSRIVTPVLYKLLAPAVSEQLSVSSQQ
ncbi:MAG: efflux RND transporter permease subunit [Chitinophagales bacterium]|nr:efflux RND transporter permease subunit [Chitinophagales bacterium]